MANTTTSGKSNGIADVVIPISLFLLFIATSLPFYVVIIEGVVWFEMLYCFWQHWTIDFKESCASVCNESLLNHYINDVRNLGKFEYTRHYQQVKVQIIYLTIFRYFIITLNKSYVVPKTFAIARNLKQGKVRMARTIIKQIGIHDTDCQPLTLTFNDIAAVETCGLH